MFFVLTVGTVLKPAVTWLPVFSRAWDSLHVATLNSHWLPVIFSLRLVQKTCDTFVTKQMRIFKPIVTLSFTSVYLPFRAEVTCFTLCSPRLLVHCPLFCSVFVIPCVKAPYCYWSYLQCRIVSFKGMAMRNPRPFKLKRYPPLWVVETWSVRRDIMKETYRY